MTYDPNKAMDDFQVKKAHEMYEQARRTPWDEFWELRNQKFKLIAIQMAGVVVSLILQLILGFYKLVPQEVLWWWILPLGAWCLVFCVLIYRVQDKIHRLFVRLRDESRGHNDERQHKPL
jgi:hypothetical protein